MVENPTQTQKSFTSQLGLYFDNKVKFEIDQYGSLKIMNIPKNLNPEQQANFDRLQAMVKDETKKIYVRIIDHTSDESAIVDDDSWESMVLDVDDASAHSPREGRYNFGTIVMHFFDEQWATQVDKKTTYKSAHDVALSKQIASSDILIVNGVQSAKTDDWNYVMTFDVIDSEQNYVQTMIRTYVDGNITSVAYKNEPEKVGKVDIKNADGQVLNSEHLTKVKPK